MQQRSSRTTQRPGETSSLHSAGLLLLLLWMGGWDAGPGLAEPAGSDAIPATRPPASASDSRAVVSVWESTAEKMRLPRDRINDTAALLEEALARAPIEVTSERLRQFEPALHRMLESIPLTARDPESAKGREYFIAFCTAEAFSRPEITEERRREVVEDYRKLDAQVLDEARKHLVAGMDQATREKWQGRIDQALSTIAVRLDERITALNGDFLFPGFKAPLSSSAKKNVLEELTKSGVYPTYAEPERMMQTKDELYAARLVAFPQDVVGGFCHYAALEPIQLTLSFNRYWGHMGYSRTSGGGFWPLDVTMFPDDSWNASIHWTPGK